MIRRVLMTAGVLAGLVFALAAPSFGGPGGVMLGDQPGDAVLLVDADGGAPMFDIPDLLVGAPNERCMRVTNAGTRAVDAKVFAHVNGGLRNALEVVITRGTLAPGAGFPTCAGFAPDATIHLGLGPGVIFRGSVAELSGRFVDATPDPGRWAPGTSRDYRFVVTLTRVPDRHDLGTTASFLWKGRGA